MEPPIFVRQINELLKRMTIRIREEAFAKGHYIVYVDSEGSIVREYPNGDIIIVKEKGESNGKENPVHD